MNGVIVQSNHLKHAAMLGLFVRWPQHLSSIDRYNRNSGGIPRRIKFRHIWQQIIQLPYDDGVELVLAEEYENALMHSLLETPLVEGVDRLFSNAEVPIYVCSAAPLEESRRQLEHRLFAPYVAAVFGEPVKKTDALRQVILQSGAHARDIVFFGDSLADRGAALEVGVRFIGVIREKNEFVGVDCLKIVDFQDWDGLCRAVLYAETSNSMKPL